MTQTAVLSGNADLYLHVRVLIGIILGLSVTRLVSGIAAIVQHPKRYQIWSVHLGWVAWALVNVVTFWWWEFRLSRFRTGRSACTSSSASTRRCTSSSARCSFRRIWRNTDTWIKGEAHLQSFGLEYLISVGVFILLCGIASITRNVKFHMAFVLVAFVHEVSFFTRYCHTLNWLGDIGRLTALSV